MRHRGTESTEWSTEQDPLILSLCSLCLCGDQSVPIRVHLWFQISMIPPPMIEFQSDPQRILLIKPSAIGDVVHALPILNLLRKRWPTAKISWLITPGCAGLLDRHPQLDEIILFERHRYATLWRDPEAMK